MLKNICFALMIFAVIAAVFINIVSIKEAAAGISRSVEIFACLSAVAVYVWHKQRK